MDKIIQTTKFLGKLSTPEYKFLTHRFDSDSDDFLIYVNRWRIELANHRGLIPESLYDLFFGFLYGPSWVDASGKEHKNFCSCDKWVDWVIENPGVHPMNEFEDIKDFANSVRVYNGTFDEIVESIFAKDYALQRTIRLNVDERSLMRFDAYMDVPSILKAMKAVIIDIASYPHDTRPAIVKVSCRREGEISGGIKVDSIIIEDEGSFSNKRFSDVRDHFESGGGFLGTLAKMTDGLALVSVESKWDGEPHRWNLTRLDNEPVDQPLDEEVATGYRYILRILHKG